MRHVTLRSMSVGAVLIAVFVIGGVAPRADQRQGGAGGPGGMPILLDFVAVGADGQPVTDLQAADVSVRISGRTRTVSSISYRKASTGRSGSTLPPPYATNVAGAGRALLIIVDVESLRAGTNQQIQESLESVLKHFGGDDRVALSVAPKDDFRIGFGAGIGAVREALGRLSGRRPASVSTTDNICRSRDSLVLLRGMIEALAPAETPTSVVYIASGLSMPSRAAGGTGQSCEITGEHYSELAASAAAARVNLYVAQGDLSISQRDDGLENLAGVTNAGSVLRVTPNGLDRIVVDSEGYYVASVQADPNDRPGLAQRLEVRSTREGVTIRSRNEVLIGSGRGMGGRGGPGGPGGRGTGGRGGGAAPTPRTMVATDAAFRDLPLRASAVASRGPKDTMTVLALAEPTDPATKLTAASAVLVDPATNKIVFQTTADEKQLVPRPMVIPMAAPAGKYRLRLAATDDTGRAGAVDVELTLGLESVGPLKFGGLMLLTPRGEAFGPALEFGSEPEIATYLEMYGQLTGPVSARFEITDSLDGKPIISESAGGQQTSEPDRFILNAKLPIAKLPAGDYLVRAVVQMEGHPEARIVRTLRKVAR